MFYAYIITRHIGNWTLTKMKLEGLIKFSVYAYIISRHIGNWTLTEMKKIKRKLLPKLLISRTLTFNISATECPIEIIFSVLDSAEQGLQHVAL